MAYDKPLKIQWTEIDGRTVPLVLPQYWSDEQDDWVVSSEQNRLPVDAQLTGSIIENDSIKTSITKNNSVRELLANTVVPAGGYVVVSAEFNGSRVGFGIRWEQTIPFRIRFQYEHLNTAVSEQITLVSRTHSRANGNIDLNLAKGSFIIWNDSQQDVIIRFFVISDFMGGSKNANSDQQFA